MHGGEVNSFYQYVLGGSLISFFIIGLYVWFVSRTPHKVKDKNEEKSQTNKNHPAIEDKPHKPKTILEWIGQQHLLIQIICSTIIAFVLTSFITITGSIVGLIILIPAIIGLLLAIILLPIIELIKEAIASYRDVEDFDGKQTFIRIFKEEILIISILAGIISGWGLFFEGM